MEKAEIQKISAFLDDVLLVQKIGQNKNDLREDHHQDNPDNNGDQERKDAFEYDFKGNLFL